jgi:hypothetical protein
METDYKVVPIDTVYKKKMVPSCCYELIKLLLFANILVNRTQCKLNFLTFKTSFNNICVISAFYVLYWVRF